MNMFITWKVKEEEVIKLLNLKEGKFFGYLRPDGKVGVRNHVLILPTITCATQAAKQITELVQGTVSFIY
jgi:altronate dehydratase large subunit